MSPAGPAPTMSTSYFSASLLTDGFGERRGSGGANEGNTRRSRDAAAYSVKTGMASAFNWNWTVENLKQSWQPRAYIPFGFTSIFCGVKEFSTEPHRFHQHGNGGENEGNCKMGVDQDAVESQ